MGKIYIVKSINLAIRFLLEMLALISFALWGFHLTGGFFTKLLLGIGTPFIAAIIWGIFGSPKASVPLQGFYRLLLEMAVFGGAAMALYLSGVKIFAALYALFSILNLILLHHWKKSFFSK